MALVEGTGIQTEPADLGVLEASARLRRRELSSLELTESCLRRIEERNGGPPSHDGVPTAINAFARVYPELALEQARAADERRRQAGDDAPPLCGVPVAVKDLYGVAGLPLTASSRVLEGNVASQDATAWARLRDQSMVLLGHTHTHEFAAGGTTDQVGNPWALDRVAGGSSGGSAAALAARMAPAAVGTDTCGSLRIPSACCGTSTIKATHGRVPIDGIIPLAPSLDHAGPMARTLTDCAALLACLADGGAQSTPLMPPPASLGELPVSARPGPRPLEGVTIALTDHVIADELDTVVAVALEEAARECRRLGARVIELPAPWTLSWDDLSIILLTEVWAYHQSFAERLDLYRPAIGQFVGAARNFTGALAYIAAQERRAQGTAAWERWFAAQGVDFVLEPTLPVLPLPRGDGYLEGVGGPGDPMIALTSLWNMTGLPVASLPVSWDVGVSLIAPRGREPVLLQTAIDLQEHALVVPVWCP
jgi:aspartyl-tRNA(Asn)/glutamyl-tRNA(Gln) amidotransferase subunit A